MRVGGALLHAPLAYGRECVAFVEDVIDQQHAATVQRRGRTMLPHQFAARGFAAVTRGMQVVEFQVQAQRTQLQGQLPGERQRAIRE